MDYYRYESNIMLSSSLQQQSHKNVISFFPYLRQNNDNEIHEIRFKRYIIALKTKLPNCVDLRNLLLLKNANITINELLSQSYSKFNENFIKYV